MATQRRFGIIGTGKIAGSFARDFARVDGGQLAAVASRRPGAAEAFAAEHGIARAHDSYEALANDPDVDVAYIATPHSRHAQDTCLLLEHGKHVLCEKPFAINAAEAQRMIDTARANDRFLMEAMWARFSPAWVAGKEQLDGGAIGEARVLTADFCFPTAPGVGHRLRDPALGGGSLLDLGVYPLGLAWFLLGEPDTLDARAVVADGIDLTTTLLAGYATGETARLVTSIDAHTTIGANLIGSAGIIEWQMPFHTSEAITVHNGDGSRRIETPDNGLHRQAQHLIDCLDEGRSESPVVPHAYTLAMMRRLDAIRADIGLRYPSER
ncbi:MAG: Gfo/Idh/MocA family oxidoreductase [Acidimicrobiia bacterium]|nr:Gfo/Idh/MocA family oxidoreductase [Acidimicrobiia bacterium]MDH5236388.1 Gfo/Idh/MocA family oxidoreductase [Acidimicrobiia bacterium]